MTFPNGWTGRIKLTSDNVKVLAGIKGLAFDFSNIIIPGFWSGVKSDGADIRITSDKAGTSLLARDVISIDTTAETGLIRFDTGGISTSADSDYYLWYGNSEADEPLATDTYGQYNAYDSRVHAYLPFNEGTGTTINDRSSNQNNGTAANTTWGDEGIINKSLHFNGSTSHVSLPNLTATSANTIMMFAKPSTALSNTTGSSSRKTVFKGDGEWNPGIWATNLQIRPHANNQYRDYTIDWNGTSWRHVGQVWNGTNVYLVWDGSINTGGSATSYSPGTTANVLLGAETTTSDSYNWAGIVDEAWLFNGDLTTQETSTIHTNTLNNDTFWTISEEPIGNGVISSTAILNGNPVEGATVRLINQSTNSYVGETTTNASGEYVFENLAEDDFYHVYGEYKDVNDDTFRSFSYPYVKPEVQE